MPVIVVFSEPGSSVKNLIVVGEDRYSVTLAWQEPTVPNGEITGYVVNITVDGQVGGNVRFQADAVKQGPNVGLWLLITDL